jgi:phosphoribosylformylglycinamidine cyclo-ligase
MTKEIIENDPYKSAGVDIGAGEDLINKIKKNVSNSHSKNVLGNIGGFAGMYKLDKEFDNPVLVACTDGVGTKVALAQQYKNLSGIGQDLVAMCVNDLVVCGAKPLFFLDYYASSKLLVDEASQVIKSISDACVNSGCALLGGETAEMPGHYVGNNFDLAGFSVGCVDEDKIIQAKKTIAGNILIGIESSGPHSNGFSLIRKILKNSKTSDEEKKSIVDKLLTPTILYPKLILDIINEYQINSMAHITGGGLVENLPRSIPDNLCVEIKTDSWELPEIFKWIKNEGDVPMNDMYRIFNCGIGMVLFVEKKEAVNISNKISDMNFKNFIIGEVKEKNKSNSVIFS